MRHTETTSKVTRQKNLVKMETNNTELTFKKTVKSPLFPKNSQKTVQVKNLMFHFILSVEPLN